MPATMTTEVAVSETGHGFVGEAEIIFGPERTAELRYVVRTVPRAGVYVFEAKVPVFGALDEGYREQADEARELAEAAAWATFEVLPAEDPAEGEQRNGGVSDAGTDLPR